MAETLEERKQRHHQEDLQRLRGFRPIDDTFMRCLFRNNIPLAEMVLRIITGKADLQLVSCEVQADFNVNGEYRGDSDVGKLMHDFNCTKASDMIFPLMAEKTRYLKENSKGVSEVCKQMEDLRNESILEGKILTLIDLVQDGSLDIAIAAAKAKMTVDEFKEEMDKAPLQVV